MLQDITEIDLRILSLYSIDYTKAYTIRHITANLDINYAHAFKRIKTLVRRHILLLSKSGQANSITINLSNLDAIRLLSFIEETSPHHNEHLEIIIKEVTAIDPFACIGLFGSRAKGSARKDSDWDVFIITAYQNEIERLKSRFSYMKDVDLQVFDINEFKESLLSTEETVIKHIVRNKQIIYNPHPFYNLIRWWEAIKHAPGS
jgi:predicted nucleotidyltransferase